MAKVKPYGFSVSVGSEEHTCLFSGRDWDVLTSYRSFSNTPGHFKSIIGLDALGRKIGVKKYPVVVHREQIHFRSQLRPLVERYEEKECHYLDYDYKVILVGWKTYPMRRVPCQFLGYSADATGGPGSCTLSIRDEELNPVGDFDLRPHQEYMVDNDQLIRIRKKKCKSEIGSTLSDLLKFVMKFPKEEIFTINLVGGDS